MGMSWEKKYDAMDNTGNLLMTSFVSARGSGEKQLRYFEGVYAILMTKERLLLF
jgi:hypothetical protein